MSEYSQDELDAMAAHDIHPVTAENTLLKFFTRREKDWWTKKDRSKYGRHVGMTQHLVAQGFTRAQAKVAVSKYHADARTVECSEGPA